MAVWMVRGKAGGFHVHRGLDGQMDELEEQVATG